MSNTNTPLKEYLRNHNLVDEEQLQALNQEQIKQSILGAGVMTQAQLQQLESLLQGFPVLEKQPKTIPVEVQAQIPYPLAKEHRIMCIESGEQKVCLITDESHVHDTVSQLFANKQITTHTVPSDTMDNLLGTYEKTTQQNLIDSITSLEKKIRVEEDFGSELMSHFFPTDRLREIAEDVSILKICRRIVALGHVMHADSISIQTRPDKVVVRMHIANTTHDIFSLNRSTAPALMYAMRYYCDLPLRSGETIQKGYTNTLSHDKKVVLPVWFTTTQTGYTIDIHGQGVDEMSAKIKELGLSDTDQRELSSFLRSKNGTCVISGKESSGKTYAYYQLIETCASYQRVVSIEHNTEYLVDKASQTSWSKRPEKDLQSLVLHNDVIAVSDARESLSVILHRIAQERKVFLETKGGVIALVKHLLAKGLSLREIARSCSRNLVSYSFDLLHKDNQASYKLTATDVTTLEQYVTIDEVRYILDQANLQGATLARLSDIAWVTKIDDSLSRGGVIGFFKRKSQDLIEEKKYIRAFVNIGYELEQASVQNSTPLELEQSIKFTQKQSLVRTAIVSAVRQEISITELITMLRA